MTPQQYCQEKVLRDGSSLFYSLRFIPIAQRHTLTALYAFFNELTEIPYKYTEKEAARTQYQWWQEEIVRAFEGNSEHPVTQALSEPIRRHQLQKHYFQELIDGLLFDLETTDYPQFEPLEDYCKRTSSVLSLLCTQVLGYQNESTLKYAEQLGIAFQLTYILRRLRRDTLRGRIYIPLDEMERFGVVGQTLLDNQLTETVQALLAYQATRVRAYYYNAFKYLPKEDRFSQRSGLVRAQLALAILQEIENDSYQLFEQKTYLTPSKKLWITWRTLWQARGWF